MAHCAASAAADVGIFFVCGGSRRNSDAGEVSHSHGGRAAFCTAFFLSCSLPRSAAFSFVAY